MESITWQNLFEKAPSKSYQPWQLQACCTENNSKKTWLAMYLTHLKFAPGVSELQGRLGLSHSSSLRLFYQKSSALISIPQLLARLTPVHNQGSARNSICLLSLTYFLEITFYLGPYLALFMHCS